MWGPVAGMIRCMRRASRAALALSLLLPHAVGCAGTETGNPSITGALSYTGFSSEPELVGVGRSGSLARVDAAWFDLGPVRAFAADSCSSTRRAGLSVPALGPGDHAAGNHNVVEYRSSDTAFCGIEVPFVRVPSSASGVPAEVAGHALHLRGTLANGVPFSIISDATQAVFLSAPQGSFELREDATDLLLAFDLAAWLRPLDFTKASVTQGQIRISVEENAELLEQFEASLAAGVLLYRDRDGDGSVDQNPELLAR